VTHALKEAVGVFIESVSLLKKSRRKRLPPKKNAPASMRGSTPLVSACKKKEDYFSAQGRKKEDFDFSLLQRIDARVV
jgi:hypothetical protein